MIDHLLSGLSDHLQGASPLAYAVAYLAGVVVSFTPCTSPVIPITVAYIGATGGASRSRGFVLSVAYVAGLALTYTALGGVAALTGRIFGQIQTNPWTYIFVANVCIFMGLSLLGALELPVAVPSFVARLRPRGPGKGLGGSFLVGAAAGLVMGPCTVPVFAVLLAYVAKSQNPLYGMSLLFVFAFGMGSLLLLLGTFAGLLAHLPKSGEWMNRIARLCGWILLFAGQYFLVEAGTLWL